MLPGNFKSDLWLTKNLKPILKKIGEKMKLSHEDPKDGTLVISLPSNMPPEIPFKWSVNVYTCGLLDPGEQPKMISIQSNGIAFRPGKKSIATKSTKDKNDEIKPRTHCWSGIRTSYMVYFSEYLNPENGSDTCTWSMIVEETGDHGRIELALRFKGTNPTLVEVSAALRIDVLRAICWNESNWRQYGGSGLPLRNTNTNGTSDWGMMQLNDIHTITNVEKWNWISNVNRGISIFEAKGREAEKYLAKHGNYDSAMLLKESIQLYNGGHFHKWDPSKGIWFEAPPVNNVYVARVLAIMQKKPWP
jgi:hypothetical protein